MQNIAPHGSGRDALAHQGDDDAYSSHFVATETAVRDVLGALRGWLQDSAINAGAQSTIELVLAEAMNNIVEHAYADTTSGRIHLRVWHHRDHLQFELSDTGQPMPDLTLPEAVLPSSDKPVCDLPEGGFGWFLIHRLTHDLRYQRNQQENRLCFCIGTNQDD